MNALATLTTTRFVSPLREGGSLPALAEASDGALYVVKFRGAGQGRKALVAEIIAGEIARTLGLNIPALALIELDPAFGSSEGDPEIQDLLRASTGLNLAMQFLPGALMFDPLAEKISPRLASQIVWFDALTLNVDRTVRNPNLLCWHERVWVIDHGASLYFHHNWASDYLGRSRSPFAPLREHILLPFTTALPQVDAEYAPQLTRATLETIVNAVPAAWLENEASFESADAVRQAYLKFLLSRLAAPRQFFTVTP